MFSLLAASEAEIGSVIVFILGAVIAIAWLVFPFIVIQKFNDLILVQREANKLLRQIVAAKEDAPKPSPQPEVKPTKVPPVPIPKADDIYRL